MVTETPETPVRVRELSEVAEVSDRNNTALIAVALLLSSLALIFSLLSN